MALINDFAHAPSTLAHDLVARIRSGLKRMVQRRAYHVTMTVLSQLSDRQLMDLGMTRSEIPSRAYVAAYGNGN